MILGAGNIRYENIVVPFGEGPGEWSVAKEEKIICPFGQLPSLQLEDGIVLAQSSAIISYVAKLARVYPLVTVDAAIADMVVQLCLDMNAINLILNVFPPDSDDFRKMYDAYFAALPGHLVGITRLVNDGHLYSGKPSKPHHGDFSLFHIINNTLTVKPSALDEHAEVKDWYAHMLLLPSVAKHLATRPRGDALGKPGSFIRTATTV